MTSKGLELGSKEQLKEHALARKKRIFIIRQGQKKRRWTKIQNVRK